MTQYRQGDLLIIRDDSADITGLPAQKRDNGRCILAYGEVTGHAHALTIDATMYGETVGDGGVLVVNEAGELVHEEHAPIALNPGRYRVIRQREYARGGIRNVAD